MRKAYGRLRHESASSGCGAVLVLQVIIVDTRGLLMGCIYFGEPDGRAERCRAMGAASACIPARTARPGYRPIRGSGRNPITQLNVAGTSAGWVSRYPKALAEAREKLSLSFVIM